MNTQDIRRRFTAEESIYETRNYYKARSNGATTLSNGVETSLMRQGLVKCENCPSDKPVPCNGESSCLCCPSGCFIGANGVPTCISGSSISVNSRGQINYPGFSTGMLGGV